jgi:hypothetical protein
MILQMHNLHNHFLTNDIVTVTQMLKALDSDDTSLLNGFYEHPKLDISRQFE